MYIKYIIDNYENKIILKDLLIRSSDYIEKNEYIEKYKNITLYEHQKQIYSVFKNKESSKLVLYIAPTATGKTLTPIGLSNTYKVIFVCAARHVGIGLSRSAISAGKKIAFAFGCSCADDIRLHYFSGSKYVKRDDGTTIIYKDGSKKIDNSVGDKVEIMICDLQSYIYAMYYMIAFNKKENIITFWDEPTITLDYENHPCHEIINKNWKENLIPNIVLSSATLPKEHEINELVSDFRTRFNFGNIYSINSSECKRTIPIINEYGCAELPHYVFDDYTKIQESVEYISKNKTIMRIASSQPTFLSYPGYFGLIDFVDKFVVMDNIQFASRSWQQRVLIQINNSLFTSSLFKIGSFCAKLFCITSDFFSDVRLIKQDDFLSVKSITIT